ncbi:MAG: hypothetical protein N2689_09370, partial [Verrucomicrobiae bacterium]|nr:hypothetical protein [Verrucomicrobiae bacterium]
MTNRRVNFGGSTAWTRWTWPLVAALTLGAASFVSASEAELKLPDLRTVSFPALGGVSGFTLMLIGIVVCAVGGVFGLVQYGQTKKLPVHDSMRNVSNIIWE